MKIRFIIGVVLLSFFVLPSFAQQGEQHISRLELAKKKKKYFNNRDSSITVYIDTLIMKDKSSLQFIGKKEVKLMVGYAEIGKNTFVSGVGSANNASNFDIHMHLAKLGSLYIIARGQDAINGTKTNPNGDGGKVKFAYSSAGITPQRTDKKAANYLYIDVSGGGQSVNPTSDLNQIYSRIATSAPGLRGLPQGQIYSGSPGTDGEVTVEAF